MSINRMTCTNQTTNWLVHNWNTFGAQMNHMHTRIHKTHHGPNLEKATTFPLIVFSMISHGDAPECHFSRDSQVRSLEILEINIPVTLGAHNFLCKPPIKLKFETKL